MKKGTCHHDKLMRLRRIEGQVRAVQKMMEEEMYCVDILHTVGATIGALKKVESSILKDHLNTCVKEAFQSKGKGNQKDKLDKIQALLGNLRK